MGRWRPPQEKSSPYITPEGFIALEQEQKAIWLRRREVVKALSAAAAEGDRSENAEYIYRKKELRELDWRIRYLQKRLPDLKIVPPREVKDNHIFFGAWVLLETESGDEVTYRIVGPDEFDPAKSSISLDSPLAKALLKKTIDDEVTIRTERGEVTYSVLEVHYKNPN
ncbi:MAG: transcription elongation factor GreB [Gammaproteobacteria bacterium]